jgi:selenocysteine lyase/cysteine desulfurase
MDYEQIAKEFPHATDLIYLNHAAVAPWPVRTCAAVTKFAEENVHQGASNYNTWVAHEAFLKSQLKQLINAPTAADIALTKNTSEALSVVACGLDWQPGDNVVTSSEEFPSNRIPWQARQPAGVELREIDLTNRNPEQALIQACDAHTRVLTISSVQYGSGLRLNMEILGNFCRQRGILFCVDAIQSIGACEFDVQAIKADFVMADGHKWMLGPEGLALFYSRPEARDKLRLHQFGWHMTENAGDFDAREWRPATTARRFECGSPNMLGIHALSASLSLLLDAGMQEIARSVRDKTSYLIATMQTIAGIRFLTPLDEDRRAGILSFKVKGVDTAELHRKLINRKIICARRGGGIRFSPHFYTPGHLLDKAVEIVKLSI